MDALDRPVWNALTSSQAHLAVVTGAAVRIDPAYGPFAAARDSGEEAQAALAATLKGPDDRIGVVEREAWPVPEGTRVLGGGDLVQMVWDAPPPKANDDPRIELLKARDARQMAALAHATEPGPWAPRRAVTATISASASAASSPRWRGSGCGCRAWPS